MFKEIIGIYCENHVKKIHTLCGKVRGFLMVRHLAHIVTAVFQNIRTNQYVCSLTGLPDESAASRPCVYSACRQPGVTFQTARFHNPEKHSMDFLSSENLECYIHLSSIKSKQFLAQQLHTSAVISCAL